MIESFNQLARIVCTEIVHEKTVHTRAKAINNYIQVSNMFKLHVHVYDKVYNIDYFFVLIYLVLYICMKLHTV